ncbi:hypothetical protein D3C81_1970890 [compost metagenome]
MGDVEHRGAHADIFLDLANERGTGFGWQPNITGKPAQHAEDAGRSTNGDQCFSAQAQLHGQHGTGATH